MATDSFKNPSGDNVSVELESDGSVPVTVAGGVASTEYTEGDTDTTITGPAIMWEDSSDTLRAVSASKPLPVTVVSGSSGQTDDTAFTPATSSVSPVGGTYRSSRDSVDDNDAGAFAMTAKRGLLAVLETVNGDSATDDTYDAVKTLPSSYATDDSAMPATPVTLPVSGEYRATPTTYTDGDATVLQTDVNGALKTASTSNIADDAAFTVGTSPITMVGGTYRSSRDTLDANDGGAFALTQKRGQLVSLETLNGDAMADDTYDALNVIPSAYATDDSTMPATPGTFPVSGEYRASATTYADGDATVLQSDVNGNLKVTNATLLAGEDLTNNVIKVEERYSYSAVAVADVQVKASAGFLHTVTISCNDAAPTAGSVIIYDNTAESGTVVFNHTFTTTPFVPLTVTLDYIMATGIYIGFTTTADVNVSCSFR